MYTSEYYNLIKDTYAVVYYLYNLDKLSSITNAGINMYFLAVSGYLQSEYFLTYTEAEFIEHTVSLRFLGILLRGLRT
jgi:hypothetical protein